LAVSSPGVTTVYLLRHAESVFLPGVPEADWPLSERGRRQAEALVPVLHGLGIGRVYSSPYRRALDTAGPFAEAAGLPCQSVEDLRERRLCEEALDDFVSAVRRAWLQPELALPGGESSRQCQARVALAVHRLVRLHPGQVLLVSSHGNAIGLLLQSLEPAFGFEDWRALRNPDLHRLLFDGGAAGWDRGYRLEMPPVR
jgi:2,3-bisphosphoglycerate-dependent phosphoglycerate mutase